MGVFLSNEATAQFNWNGWNRIIATAIDYGWRPLGTKLTDMYTEGGKVMEVIDDDGVSKPRSKCSWGGDYCSNDFQEVTEPDAKNLGKALKKYQVSAMFKTESPVWQEMVTDLIKVCEAGAFVIS